MTKPEHILWKKLRELPPELNATFRRQHPVPPYILDFACLKIKLAIELDGASHDTAQAQNEDSKRDAYVKLKGYTILRFTNADVMRDLGSLVATIILECTKLQQAHTKALPPRGEGWVGASGVHSQESIVPS